MNNLNNYKLLKSDISNSAWLLILIYGIINYVTITFLLPVIAAAVLGANSFLSDIAVLTMLVQFLVAMPVAIFIMRAITGIPLKSLFKSDAKIVCSYTGKSIGIFAGVMFVSTIVTLVVTQLLSLLKVQSETPDILGMPDGLAQKIIFGLSVVVLGPVAEEIIFRGYLTRILSKYNKWFAIIVTSAMFGVYHGNIEQGVNAFFLGVFLAVTAIKTKSIIVPIILHILNNLISFVFMLLPQTDSFVMISNIIYLLILFIAGIICFFAFRKDFKIEKTDNIYNGQICAKAFFSSFASWLFIVVFALIMIMSFTVSAIG